MTAELSVGLIAYPVPDEPWAETVASVVDGEFLLVVSDPPDSFYPAYADMTLTSDHRIGFGQSRRLSMILAGESADRCIVADGDGQYAPSAFRTLQQRLHTTDAEAVIPQRDHRTVWVDYEGQRVSREPFERLETLCAGRVAGVELDPSFDCQPGGFAFQASALPEILPEGNWIADWEVTTNILQTCQYDTVTVTTNDEPQDQTTFAWADQVTKLRRMRQLTGVDVEAVFRDHTAEFDDRERQLITTALNQAASQW